MKGLWRAAALLFLPGMAAGSLIFDAFFRLLNLSDDTLALWAAGGALWTASAAVAAAVMSKLSRAGQRYYEGAGGFLCLLALGSFLSDILDWGILPTVLWQIPLSGAGCAVMLSALTGSVRFTAFDRRCWSAGMVCFAAVAGGALIRHIGHLLPAGHCYLAVLTLFCFFASSPPTRRGSRKSRAVWAAALLSAMGLRMAAPPCYLPPPSGLADREAGGGRHWNSTATTPDGWRYLWSDSEGRRAFYTAGNRLVAAEDEDMEYRAAIPGVLGALERDEPDVLVIAGPGSVWPGLLHETNLCHSLTVRVTPPTLDFFRPDAFRPATTPSELPGQFDLIALLTLPPRQYPDHLTGFVAHLEHQLADHGILLIPEILLERQQVFRELTERFPYNGILPGPGRVRIFSRRYHDLSVPHLDRELNHLYGDDAPLPYGTYTLLFANAEKNQPRHKMFQFESITLGGRSLLARRAPWRLWLTLALLPVLWRLVRLPLERHGAGYRMWNSAENGFAWFWTLGLAMLVALTCFGIAPGMLLALLPLGGALAADVISGGALLSLGGVTALTLPVWCNIDQGYLPLAAGVVLQSALFSGRLLWRRDDPPRERRKFLAMWFSGGFCAILLLAAALLLETPLLPLGLLGIAARLPALWQKCEPRAILWQTKG